MNISKKTFNKYKKRLNPIATSLALIYKEIEDKPTRELNYLLKHGGKLNQTNCWWATYRAFEIIKPIIEEELERRKYQNK